MGFWSAIGNAVKGVVTAPQKAVRGLGRLARGHFREGLGDLGGAASGASSVLHLLPGVGTGAAAAIGSAGEALQGLTRKAGGGFEGDIMVPEINGPVGNARVNGGLSNFLDNMDSEGPGGMLDSIKDFALSKKGLTAGLALAGLLDQRSRRKQAEAYNQQRLNTLMAALTKAEGQMDERQAMGSQANASLLAALSQPGFLSSQLR